MAGDVKQRERDDENLGYTLPPDYQVRDTCMTAGHAAQLFCTEIMTASTIGHAKNIAYTRSDFL